MLSPQEIAQKRFDRPMGRGYKQEEVERFLAHVAGEMQDLLDEKQELETKLMVLADKLEEYKNDEESLRAALLGAQKLGDSVVREAKARAEAIIAQAQAKADAMIEDTRQAMERERSMFTRLQREVSVFKSRLQLLYKQHLELISSIPGEEEPREEPAPTPKAAPPVEEAVPEAVAELPQEELDQEMEFYLPEEEEEQEDALSYSDKSLLEYSREEPEPKVTPRYESRFGPLKFGKEYDLKRDDEKRKR